MATYRFYNAVGNAFHYQLLKQNNWVSGIYDSGGPSLRILRSVKLNLNEQESLRIAASMACICLLPDRFSETFYVAFTSLTHWCMRAFLL